FMRSIVNNSVFRLEVNERYLATQVLALWRKVVPLVWFDLYHAEVVGFETFVVETSTRVGALYRADNWEFVGRTAGTKKSRKGLHAEPTRTKTESKLIFARKYDFSQTGWHEGDPGMEWVSSWRGRTPEEKRRGKELSAHRKTQVMGKVYFLHRLRLGLEGVHRVPAADWPKLVASGRLDVRG